MQVHNLPVNGVAFSLFSGQIAVLRSLETILASRGSLQINQEDIRGQYTMMNIKERYKHQKKPQQT